KPAITAVATRPTRVASPTRTPRAATNHGHSGVPAVRAPTRVPATSSATRTTERRQPAFSEWTRLNAATSVAGESSAGSPERQHRGDRQPDGKREDDSCAADAAAERGRGRLAHGGSVVLRGAAENAPCVGVRRAVASSRDGRAAGGWSDVPGDAGEGGGRPRARPAAGGGRDRCGSGVGLGPGAVPCRVPAGRAGPGPPARRRTGRAGRRRRDGPTDPPAGPLAGRGDPAPGGGRAGGGVGARGGVGDRAARVGARVRAPSRCRAGAADLGQATDRRAALLRAARLPAEPRRAEAGAVTVR